MRATRKIVQNVDSDQCDGQAHTAREDLEAKSSTECRFMLQVTVAIPTDGVTEYPDHLPD